MPFQMIRQDAETVRADAIVRFVSIDENRNEVEPTLVMENGRFVIVAPQSSEKYSDQSIYRKCLALAYQKECRSIALPLLTAEDCPMGSVLPLAVQTIADFLSDCDLCVSCGFRAFLGCLSARAIC